MHFRVKEYIDECNHNKTCVDISSIENIEEICSLIEKNNKDLEEAKKSINKIKSEHKNIQDRCNHELKNYHYDPSGNNDNYYQCCICGKDF